MIEESTYPTRGAREIREKRNKAPGQVKGIIPKILGGGGAKAGPKRSSAGGGGW